MKAEKQKTVHARSAAMAFSWQSTKSEERVANVGMLRVRNSSYGYLLRINGVSYTLFKYSRASATHGSHNFGEYVDLASERGTQPRLQPMTTISSEHSGIIKSDKSRTKYEGKFGFTPEVRTPDKNQLICFYPVFI